MRTPDYDLDREVREADEADIARGEAAFWEDRQARLYEASAYMAKQTFLPDELSHHLVETFDALASVCSHHASHWKDRELAARRMERTDNMVRLPLVKLGQGRGESPEPPPNVRRKETDTGRTPVFRCVSAGCPGYPYRASERPHPAETCGFGGTHDRRTP